MHILGINPNLETLKYTYVGWGHLLFLSDWEGVVKLAKKIYNKDFIKSLTGGTNIMLLFLCLPSMNCLYLRLLIQIETTSGCK